MAQKGESSNWVIDKAITIAERLAVETIDGSIPRLTWETSELKLKDPVKAIEKR